MKKRGRWEVEEEVAVVAGEEEGAEEEEGEGGERGGGGGCGASFDRVAASAFLIDVFPHRGGPRRHAECEWLIASYSSTASIV